MRAVHRILNDMRNPSDILLTCAWVCMGLDDLCARMPPRGNLPNFATSNALSMCHEPQPGPTLAPWCSGGLPACPGAENTRNDPRPEEETMPMCKKTQLYIVIHGIYMEVGLASVDCIDILRYDYIYIVYRYGWRQSAPTL